MQKAALEVQVGEARESFPCDIIFKARGVGADVELGEEILQVP